MKGRNKFLTSAWLALALVGVLFALAVQPAVAADQAPDTAEPVELAEARAYVDMALQDCWLLLEKDSRADVLWVHADEVLAVLSVEKGAIRVLPRLEGWPRAASAYRTISSRNISSERMGELVEAQLRRRLHDCKRGPGGWRDIESAGR